MKKIGKIRNSFIVIWICLLSFGLTIAGELLFELKFNLPFLNKDANDTFNLYISFWRFWFVILLFIIIFKQNRYILNSIKYNPKGNTISKLIFGLLIGFLTNGICAGVAILHGDISIHFSKFELLTLIIIFLAVFVQSSAEELLCRGFMYQRLSQRFKTPIIPILISSGFFATLHLGNESISALALLDLFLAGIFFGLIMICFNSLWMAMAAHTSWNFTQNILLGLPNSGEISRYSVYILDNNSAKNSFAYNVGFGIEGTIVAIIVMLIFCLILWLLYTKKLTNNEIQLTNS